MNTIIERKNENRRKTLLDKISWVMLAKCVALYVAMLVLHFALAIEPARGTEPLVAATLITAFVAWSMLNSACRLVGGPVSLVLSAFISMTGILFTAKAVIDRHGDNRILVWCDEKIVALGKVFGKFVEAGTFTNVAVLVFAIALIVGQLLVIDRIGRACGLNAGGFIRSLSATAAATTACLMIAPLGVVKMVVPESSIANVMSARTMADAMTVKVAGSTKIDYSLPKGFGTESVAEYLLPNVSEPVDPVETAVAAESTETSENQNFTVAVADDFSLPTFNGLSGPDASLFPMH